MSEAVDRGLEFVERCTVERDVNTLVKEFQGCIRDFGFKSCAGGGWTGIGKNRVHRFFFNDWPQDWMEMYAREKWFQDDPFVLESRRRMSPFSWHEIEKQQHLTPRGMEMYNRGRAYGWTEVWGFPLHGPWGYQGFVSLASMQDMELGPRDRGVLYAMATVIHDRCRLEFGFGLPPDAIPKMSTREIECLQWAALGKTDWEIGQLLGITDATAHYHIERAKKKLGVTSRVQAVAQMVLQGLI